MYGRGVHWFIIVRELNNNLSWEVFKTELLNRFGGITNLNSYEQLATLYQSDNVDDYIDHFETIATMVPRESEALYLGYFMNGMRPEIKNWVWLLSPETRIGAFTKAKNVEAAIRTHGGGWSIPRPKVEGGRGVGNHVNPYPILKYSGNGQPASKGPKPSPNTPQAHSPYVRHTAATPPPPTSLLLSPNQPPPTPGIPPFDTHRAR